MFIVESTHDTGTLSGTYPCRFEPDDEVLFISPFCHILSYEWFATAWRRIERDLILYQRELFIHRIYEEYKKAVSPTSWRSLPTIEQILLTEPFLSLHNSTSDVLLDHTSCSEGIGQLPTIVSRLRNNFTDQLERSLSAARVCLNFHLTAEPCTQTSIWPHLCLHAMDVMTLPAPGCVSSEGMDA